MNGQMNIFDFLPNPNDVENVRQVDIKGICDDAYCPKCGRALADKYIDRACPDCGQLLDWTRWHKLNDHYRKEYRLSCEHFLGAVPFEGEHDDPNTNMCNCQDDGTITDEWMPCNPDRCPKHKKEVGLL